MAKPDDTPIDAAAVTKYAQAYSDFSFEMSVLSLLDSLRLHCEHGGTYLDPAKEKPREFDIRATQSTGSYTTLFAVECKNIRPTNPLVVHAVPRRETDSFHQILVKENVQFDENLYRVQRKVAGLTLCTVFPPRTRYRTGDLVGKSLDQIAFQRDGSVAGKDGGVYDRFSQAINSSAALIQQAMKTVRQGQMAATVIPVLVVPDDRLWVIPYDAQGRAGTPTQTPHLSYLVRHGWEIDTGYGSMTFTISHVEIATMSALSKLFPDFSTSGLFF